MVRIIDVKEVMRRTGLGRTTIWRNRKDRDSDFPPCRKLSKRRIGWPDARIDRWILRNAVPSSTHRLRRRRLVGRRRW
ncbi:AlpA family phage regulatory protein [Rhizobium sullae]|uniref:helix-turn-helix transcriptional regulator n=1 Tax=Rhizobium sullae TaxID=50338 RepID=UPI000B354ACB